MLFIAKCLNNIGKTYKCFTHTELLFSSSNGKVFNIHVTFIFIKAIFKKKQKNKSKNIQSSIVILLNLKILTTKTIEFFISKNLHINISVIYFNSEKQGDIGLFITLDPKVLS